MSSQDIDYAALSLAVHAEASGLIFDRFEVEKPPKRLFYHVRAHTNGVRDRAAAIGARMGLSERELLLADIAASFHDTVQDWMTVSKDGKILRQRYAGQNEVASAKEAVDYMGMLGTPFSPKEKGLVAAAILATIPDWSVEHGTVVQPFLTPESHKVVRAVALADLGEAGMDPVAFAKGGATIFAEDNIDVVHGLSEARTPSSLTEETRDAYRSRFLGWLGTQPGFARGRKALLESELEGLGDSAPSVAELFGSFDQSIAAAEAALEEAKAMDFVTLMRKVLPDAFSRSE